MCLKSALAAHLTNTDPAWVAVEGPALPEKAPGLVYQKLCESASTLYVSVANSPDDFYLQKEEVNNHRALLRRIYSNILGPSAPLIPAVPFLTTSLLSGPVSWRPFR